MRSLSLRSVLRLVALVVAAGVLMPAAARAEEQPAILKAYGLDWIERVRDDAWPQQRGRPRKCEGCLNAGGPQAPRGCLTVGPAPEPLATTPSP